MSRARRVSERSHPPHIKDVDRLVGTYFMTAGVRSQSPTLRSPSPLWTDGRLSSFSDYSGPATAHPHFEVVGQAGSSEKDAQSCANVSFDGKQQVVDKATPPDSRPRRQRYVESYQLHPQGKPLALRNLLRDMP